MPVARLHQPRGDVVERAGGAVDRPAQGDEHADHQVERLERLRRGCLPGLQRRWRRGGIDGRRAAALGKELEEAGLVLTEAASVVMTHDLAAPGLRCRAEQARCAFLGDQADLDGTGDDRPRVVGAPDGTRPHGLEGGVRRVFRLAVMGACERSVLADRELHESLGLRVLPPSPVADALAVVEALEDGSKALGGGERGAHSPSPSGLAADVVGRFGAEWRIVRVAVVGVRRARRTSSAWRSIPRPTIGPTYEPSSVGRTQATRFCVRSRAGCSCWRDGSRWRASSLAAGSTVGWPAAPVAGSCGGGTRCACS